MVSLTSSHLVLLFFPSPSLSPRLRMPLNEIQGEGTDGMRDTQQKHTMNAAKYTGIPTLGALFRCSWLLFYSLCDKYWSVFNACTHGARPWGRQRVGGVFVTRSRTCWLPSAGCFLFPLHRSPPGGDGHAAHTQTLTFPSLHQVGGNQTSAAPLLKYEWF